MFDPESKLTVLAWIFALATAILFLGFRRNP